MCAQVDELPAGRAANAVPFIERQDAECAWPLWDDATPMDERKVCGARRADPDDDRRPYCVGHERIAHRPPETLDATMRPRVVR